MITKPTESLSSTENTETGSKCLDRVLYIRKASTVWCMEGPPEEGCAEPVHAQLTEPRRYTHIPFHNAANHIRKAQAILVTALKAITVEAG
jgi:hypothetical protein